MFASAFFRTFPVLAAALLAAGPAAAEEKSPFELGIHQWLKDGPVKPEDLRGRAVILHFFHPYCAGASSPSYYLRKIQDGYDPKVRVIGVCYRGMDSYLGLLPERKVSYPVGMDPGLSDRFGVRGWPGIVILDAEGKTAYKWKGPPSMFTTWDVKGRLIEVEEALRKTLGVASDRLILNSPPGSNVFRDPRPPGAPVESPPDPFDAAALAKDYGRAEELLAAGDVRGAVNLLKGVAATETETLMIVLMAREKLVEVETAGEARLEEILAAAAGRPPADVLADLRRLRESHAGLALGTRIAQAARNFEPPPETPEQKAAARGEAEARASLDEGRKRQAAGKLADAYDAFARCAERFPERPAGREAKAAAEAMKADPEIWARVEAGRGESEAKRLLGLGRSFLSAGFKDKARSHLEEVTARFPGTPQAKEAEGLLKGIK